MNAAGQQLPVYYVSAHSKIPKMTGRIKKIPENTYLIMTVKCGNYSYVKNQNFLREWASTPEGVQRLREYLTRANRPKVIGENSKRIYRPGNKGPIDQPLQFMHDIFFIGVQRAPVNLQKIQVDTLRRVKQLPLDTLIQAFGEIQPYYKRTGGAGANFSAFDSKPEQAQKSALVREIAKMLPVAAGHPGKRISLEQLEKAITDPLYLFGLIHTRETPFEYLIRGEKSMSELIRNKGGGIYIMDACRGVSKIEILPETDQVVVEPSRFPKHNQQETLTLNNRGGVMLRPDLNRGARLELERRIVAARKRIGKLRGKEEGRQPKRRRPNPEFTEDI